MRGRTTLRRTEVFARGRGTRAAAARLLNAKGAALDHLTLETFLGSVGLLTSGHVDETETTRLLGVGVQHDGAVLDVTILLEQARNIGLGQTRVDTSHEQVGAGVLGALLIFFLRGQMGLAQGSRTAEPRLAKDDSVRCCSLIYLSSARPLGERLRARSPRGSSRGEALRSRSYWGSSGEKHIAWSEDGRVAEMKRLTSVTAVVVVVVSHDG